MLKIEEIQRFIDEDKLSKKKGKAIQGAKYYDSEHDILNFRMFSYDSDGQLVEDKLRSNSRICHPFFTELVDQEVQYMLSNSDGFVHTDIPELQNELDKYFDDEFRSELSETLTDTVSKGFGYLHAYKKANDKLGFEYVNSIGVVEIRAKDTDDKCSYIIYWYIDRVDKGQKVIKRIMVADDKQTYFYVQEDDGAIEMDTEEEINPLPHYYYTKEEDNADYWSPLGFIPFFRLDNNKKQVSGLKPIKALIDDYDLMACGLSNNLKDFDTPIHIVRGYEGEDLDKLVTNLKSRKVVGVDTEGGVDVKTVDIPYSARQAKLELDEKNIYRFGMGFNSAQLGDGNITNIVIKSRYALLDLKCNKLELRLKAMLKKIIKVVIDEINEQLNTTYSINDVWIEFKREVITNALDNAEIEKTDAERKQTEINTLLSLQQSLGDKETMKLICDALDIDYEGIKDKIPQEIDSTSQAKKDLNDIEIDGDDDANNDNSITIGGQ
jgi:SPP1 family phage portal protein